MRGEPVLTDAGKVMGTPSYMAPEQAERPAEVDHRADIYALGVVFYQMLTGELPGQPPQPPSTKVQVDVRLDEVVLRALEKNPELRYQQASQVKTAVETVQAPEPACRQPTREVPSASWEAVRRRLRPVTTALITLGLLGLVISMFLKVNANVLRLTLGSIGYWQSAIPVNWASFLAAIKPLVNFLNFLVLLGAFRMRRLESFWLAVSAALLAMVTPPMLPIGLPVGTWALFVLARKDVRREFGALGLANNTIVPASPPRFSRFAVAGFILATVNLLIFWLYGAAAVLSPHEGRWLWSFVSAALNWTYAWPFLGTAGTVLLAGIALEDIRRGKHPLKGAGIAAFAILLMPLHQALSLPFKSMAAALETQSDEAAFGFLKSAIASVLCAAVVFWMHRSQQRRLAKPVASSARERQLYPKWQVRMLQLIGTAFLILQYCQNGFVTRLIQPWTELSYASRTAFYSHAESHPVPVMGIDSPRFFASLPSGAVELLSVSDLSSASPICWQADGTLMCRPTNTLASTSGKPSQSRTYALTLLLPNAFANYPYELTIDGKVVGSLYSFEKADRTLTFNRTFLFFSAPPGASLLDFRIGEPVAEWMDTDAGWEWTGQVPRHPERGIRRSGQEAIVSLTRAEEGPGPGITAGWWCSSFPKDWVARIIAVDVTGAVHEPITNLGLPFDVGRSGSRGQIATFNDLTSSRTKELRLQIRNYQWAEVRNVSLQPGYNTNVEMKDSSAAPLSSTPVIERVLGDMNSGGPTEMLNLSSGESFSLSNILQNGSFTRQVPSKPEEIAWLRKQGIDAGGYFDTDRRGLVVWDCSVRGIGKAGWTPADEPEVKHSGWSNKSIGDIVRAMPPPVLNSSQVLSGTPPQVWLLKNRTGTCFVLEITGISEKPRGVKARYKLVQISASPNSTTVGSSDRLRVAVKAIEAFGGSVIYDRRGRVVKVDLLYARHDAFGNPVGDSSNTNNTDAASEWLPSFTDAKELILQEGQASDRAMVFIATLTNLTVLGLLEAKVTDTGLRPLTNLIHLRELYIRESGLTDKALPILSRLPKLEGLTLPGNHFTDDGLRNLTNLVHLKSLWLGSSHGRITDEGARWLGLLRDLDVLELQNTHITDAGLEHLRGLTRLRTLLVKGTAVTPEGIRKLKEAIPGIKVDTVISW